MTEMEYFQGLTTHEYFGAAATGLGGLGGQMLKIEFVRA